MVDFIDDQQVEKISDPSHVPIGAFKCRYRERMELPIAIAIDSDRPRIKSSELLPPLFEKDTSRNENQSP